MDSKVCLTILLGIFAAMLFLTQCMLNEANEQFYNCMEVLKIDSEGGEG